MFCLIMSVVSDWMIKKECLSITNVRKINASISSVVSPLFMISAVYSGCNKIWAVILTMIAMTMKGSYFPGPLVNILDLSPNYAGTLMGISNGIASFTGILAPNLVGLLAPHQTIDEWKTIFWIIFVLLLIVNTIFICFGSGEVQKWNDPEFLNKNRTEFVPKVNKPSDTAPVNASLTS